MSKTILQLTPVTEAVDDDLVIIHKDGAGTDNSITAENLRKYSVNETTDWDNPSDDKAPKESAIKDLVDEIISVETKPITLADDAQINIADIFDTARDGEYLIMWDFDPLTWGRIHYTQGSPSNATIVDGSANFVFGDVDTKLCLVQVVDDIFLKNRLGDEYDFIVYRRGV
jgi:hypothetical protein